MLWEKSEILHRDKGPYSRTPGWNLRMAAFTEADCNKEADIKHFASYSIFTELRSRITANHRDRSILAVSGSFGDEEATVLVPLVNYCSGSSSVIWQGPRQSAP